ncbi:MAG: phosphoenolpyruvate carboxykinase, partial [Pyramidobacter porci]|nr:phosphoenolpyruvate carboxykinase [Pyramidobacter porci]
MVELERFENAELFKKINDLPVRTIVETPFYGNNVTKIESVAQAYELAKNSPGTLELTGMPVYKPEAQGLPKGANVLMFNDGAVVGRAAAARRIVGTPGVDTAGLCKIVREAVYQGRFRRFYEAETVVGLDKDFTVRARLLIPEGFENNLLSWMLNFQFMTDEVKKFYAGSRVIPGEGDILVYSDP